MSTDSGTTDHMTRDDGRSLADRIEVPGESDVERLGELFYEDMLDLGIDVELDALTEMAGELVEGARREPPDCLVWVVRPEETDEAAGVIVANFHWSLKFGGRSLWIEELYVTPDQRRRGFGRALVDRVVAYAEAHDLEGIDLEAYRGNTPASILYRTAGFRRLGRERFYYRIGEKDYL
jgi:ribosomal protein S18 acetylase RimI-like enzyme